MTETTLERRARGYAAKFRADTIGTGQPLAPTDDNLAIVLSSCVRPARPEEYGAIRVALALW